MTIGWKQAALNQSYAWPNGHLSATHYEVNMNKNIHIFGGGTVSYVSSHLALSAPAYGSTARKIADFCRQRFDGKLDIQLELTNMALGGHGPLNTVEDISNRVDQLIESPLTKIIFFSCAIVDYTPSDVSMYTNDLEWSWAQLITKCGKYESRIDSRKFPEISIDASKSQKIISNIRKERKDIFLVGFKTTCGLTDQEMYLKGLKLCKESSCNLVLVNDVKRRHNMIITPEEAAYCETGDREKVLSELVDMAYHRSHLSFTRSTVVSGDPVPWSDERVPESLRTVVDYCISSQAYKPFNRATVGHFACKLSDTEFLTSIRKSNFNDLDKNGLVYVKTDGPDSVLAYGAKPSVGGQSQRIIFSDHTEADCVVHFHSPLKDAHTDDIPVVSQREVECGSHECGKNTSNNLKQFGNLKCVMLDNHGPNIVFNRSINPKEVIDFISRNFELSEKTGGYLLET